MTTAQAVGALSHEAVEWYAIDWPTINRNVRRLQVRIVQATKAGNFRLEAASPLKRRSQGLSCVIGNFHAQFLEGWTGAIPSGYSVNCHVRF
jgi:N-terminal domain of reverse transcriptase